MWEAVILIYTYFRNARNVPGMVAYTFNTALQGHADLSEVEVSLVYP